MPHFRPDPESLCDLGYTPRFHCLLCGASVPAVCLSECTSEAGVVREIECPACHSLERVGIRLAEDFSGWVLFQAEAQAQDSALEGPAPGDSDR